MFTNKDLAKCRADTPGCHQVVHFNNAGSALPTNSVLNAQINYLKEEAMIGGYEAHAKHHETIEATYSSVANLLNAQSHEIALMENATQAWNAAFQAISFQEGDEIIVNQCDYASNYLACLHHLKAPKIRVIPNTTQGDMDMNALKAAISDKTRLIAITHMPTNGGVLAPAEEIGAIAKEHHVLYLLDACQTAGQYPLDVEQLQCDMLSATGRKYLRGPRGTGFLYVRQSRWPELIPYTIDLHSATWTGENTYTIRQDARKFETWESNKANVLGLKAAVDYARNIGLESIWERVQYLSQNLRAELSTINGVEVHDQGTHLGGIVSFTKAGLSAEKVQQGLRKNQIHVSWSGIPNTYLDMTRRGLKEIVRASVHYYNSDKEIGQFIKALKEL